jgi:hypothetical protein
MMRLPLAIEGKAPTQPGGCVESHPSCESLPSALFLVALLTGLAGDVLLLLTGLGLPAVLPRPLLTAALLLLLPGLLVGCLRRLRSVIRIIHLSTSFG